MEGPPAGAAPLASGLGEVEWDERGTPRSRRYGDVYFSREDGLAESRAVFLAGCGLPDAWAGRARYSVAELGFGTGLNVLALLQLWAGARPADGRLHVMSVEAHPLSREEAARALAAWPELADLAAPLLASWPESRGVRRIDWPALNASLDVIVVEAGEALAGWDGRADAWFLDGFAPAKNPEMWRDAVLAGVAARSTPGARAATFTVAGAVRRGLAAQGFAVSRRPGHGRKRERLEAVLETPPPAVVVGRLAQASGAAEVLVVGGGIAAAALVRALAAQGVAPRVLSAAGRGASGAPAALVTPKPERGETPAAQLYAQAFVRAADLYADTPGAVLARGVRQLGGPDARERFEALARSPLYARGALEPVETPEGPALAMHEALVVDPRRVVEHWLAAAPRIHGGAAMLAQTDRGWAVLDDAGAMLAQAAHVVLAAGVGLLDLRPDLGLQAVRGQVSLAPGLDGPAAAWGGYCIPTSGGLLFGATHDRDDRDERVRAADHARNLTTLRDRFPELADAAQAGQPLAGWAAVRATTPDRVPLAGPADPPGSGEPAQGLWLLGGLGSRGFTTAPLLAEHVAASITGAPSPLPVPLAAAVDPGRFAARAARRRGR